MTTSLLIQDKLIVALRLAQIKLSGNPNVNQNLSKMLLSVIKSSSVIESSLSETLVEGRLS